MKTLLVVIVGPTAVGKTDIAIKLAREIEGEIISADSRQIYKYFDIGTAKPSKIERSSVVYHLVDFVEPNEDYNVAAYRRQAIKLISDISNRGKVPILVGGSGLYVRAVTDGLFEVQASSHEVREKLREERRLFGNKRLYSRLKKVDPETASKVNENDFYRIMRALEVYEIEGVPVSKLRSQWKEDEEPQFNLVMMGLAIERAELYGRIEDRVDKMFNAGLLGEVEAILRMGVDRKRIAMQGIGYKEIVDYLNDNPAKGGRLEEVKRLIKRNTRRFAKRQLTWFRRDSRIDWINVLEYSSKDEIVNRMKKIINQKKGV